jgi:hypothetical protein
LEDFSRDYLDAGHLFAEHAKTLEQEIGTPENLSKVNIPATTDHFSYVSGSIFAVNACLNAAIDEVFRDADRLKRDPKAQTILDELSVNVVKDMAIVRRAKAIELSKYPDLDKILKNTNPRPCRKNAKSTCLPAYKGWYLLDKFQLALHFSESGKPFDLGSNVWGEAEFLRSLRNYLVHYEPEWVQYTFSNGSYSARRTKTVDVMDGLRTRRFRNGLYPKDADLLEGRLVVRLGADCATWAVRSCAEFLCSFYDALPIDDRKMWVYSKGYR